jgi:hypothetical protein
MTTFYATDDEIERIARGMRERWLPKPEWTHAAHFASALWLLRHAPAPALERAMPPLIRAYNAATGVANTDTDGYHETITLASIAAARAVLAAAPPERPLHQVLDDLMAGPLGASAWPLAYWSKARLFSPQARRGWVDPDLAPFDPQALGYA